MKKSHDEVLRLRAKKAAISCCQQSGRRDRW